MNMLQFVSSQKSMQRWCSNLDDCYFFIQRLDLTCIIEVKKGEKKQKTKKQTNKQSFR